jgi:hypothetical protein
MIEHLIELQEKIRASGGLENLFDNLVDEEIIERLKRKRRRDS